MKFQFIKNCPKNSYTMNKSYRKYNIIDNCYIWDENSIIRYGENTIEYIPREYLKKYKH